MAMNHRLVSLCDPASLFYLFVMVIFMVNVKLSREWKSNIYLCHTNILQVFKKPHTAEKFKMLRKGKKAFLWKCTENSVCPAKKK